MTVLLIGFVVYLMRRASRMRRDVGADDTAVDLATLDRRLLRDIGLEHLAAERR